MYGRVARYFGTSFLRDSKLLELITPYCLQQEDSARLVQAVTRETKIELETKGNAPIKKEDLISHPKRLVALATLHTSLVRHSLCFKVLSTADVDTLLDRNGSSVSFLPFSSLQQEAPRV